MRMCRSSGWWRCSIRCGRTARHPLFQVMLAFQNLAPMRCELPGLSVSGVGLGSGAVAVRSAVDRVGRLRRGRCRGGIGGLVDVRDGSVRRGDGGAVRGAVRAGVGGGGGRSRMCRWARSICSSERRAGAVLARWNATEHPVPEAATSGVVVRRGGRRVRRRGGGGVRRTSRVDLCASSQRGCNRLARWLIAAGVGSGVAGGVGDAAVAGSGRRDVCGGGGRWRRMCRSIRIIPANGSSHILDDARPALVLTTSGDGFAAAGIAGGRGRRARSGGLLGCAGRAAASGARRCGRTTWPM